MELDVTELRALALSDPEEFERRRIALIEDVIASAPPDIQRRLRGTQFRVDMERQRASNPLSATLRISRLMWESFSELREQLNGLADATAEGKAGEKAGEAPAQQAATTAAIIPLRRPAPN